MTFNAWLNIEFLILISYICSAVIFLFIRCFTKDRWDLNFDVEITTENTDALEQKYLSLEVFQAFCAPMMVTYFFFIQNPNMDNSTRTILIAFFWMNFAQTIFCIFINFVQIHELRTRGTPPNENKLLRWWAELNEKIRPSRNAMMPKIQFAMYYLLVILLPLAMIILFGYASIFTDLYQATIAPWLLACVVNNLILLTFVNWLILIPAVEAGRHMIK